MEWLNNSPFDVLDPGEGPCCAARGYTCYQWCPLDTGCDEFDGCGIKYCVVRDCPEDICSERGCSFYNNI
ncbi:hypothetical protein OF820_06350 [Oceanotoga sp. DSM 15011]|uniref:hypothetical protein n=1 Tax=Oceanotoga sp. DSM 15011 TaxID=2984951 RepID=UPI0021F3E095|nr:hypothetical protein [Oceanotoga sp. DSM 15011]UYP01305.1 hypothetical protein OF820_06350 [Oceanotoga sp. DSM 15011]